MTHHVTLPCSDGPGQPAPGHDRPDHARESHQPRHKPLRPRHGPRDLDGRPRRAGKVSLYAEAPPPRPGPPDAPWPDSPCSERGPLPPGPWRRLVAALELQQHTVTALLLQLWRSLMLLPSPPPPPPPPPPPSPSNLQITLLTKCNIERHRSAIVSL